MKPIALVLSLSIGWAAAAALARGQSPPLGPDPAWLALGQPLYSDSSQPDPFQPWGPPPAPPIPEAFLWQDYRGATIEHDLYRPRHLHASDGQRCPGPVVSLLSRWLDSLFAFLPAPRTHAACSHCGPPCHWASAMRTGQGAAGDCGCFLPPAPALSVPSPAGSGDPPVADLDPPRPLPTPEPDARPPERVPPYLPPAHGPVVELVPEPANPAEPSSPLPPRNRIPTPGERLPRNVIPSR